VGKREFANGIKTPIDIDLVFPLPYELQNCDTGRSAFVDNFFIVFPKNVDEALTKLMPVLTRGEKTRIVNMDEKDLAKLLPTFGVFIRSEFRLWGNDPLIDDCGKFARENGLSTAEPVMVIIWALWKKLQDANLLKIVK
jgi:hypothetical protein